jgi:hypothetical protein
MDGLMIGAYIRGHRSASALGAIAGRILDFKAFEKKGIAQDAAGCFHALASAAVKADSEHESLRLLRAK